MKKKLLIAAVAVGLLIPAFAETQSDANKTASSKPNQAQCPMKFADGKAMSCSPRKVLASPKAQDNLKNVSAKSCCGASACVAACSK